MDKNELETRKKNLENTIKLYGDVVEAAQKEIDEVNEQLKQWGKFTNIVRITKIYVECELSFGSKFLENALESKLTMLELANWCNAQNKSTGKTYELSFDNIYKKIDWVCTHISKRSIVKFTSMNSAELALEQINSNPELKRLAMIFLGANDENANL